MRLPRIAPGEYYHIFNRGVLKQDIFLDDRDYARFLFLLLHLQSLATIGNTSYHITKFIDHRVTDTSKFCGFGSVSRKTIGDITSQRHVELAAFCLMPNHFHACVREVDEGGIAKYMQRVLMGYAKYFNTKYNVSGHLLQGPYQAVHVENNEHLLHLSAYIHRNPRELPGWKNNEHTYPWSSLYDCTHENRWGKLLVLDMVSGQFATKEEYAHFVQTSPAKADEVEEK